MTAIAKSPSRDHKTADESLPLSHFLELAHAIGEQAEGTAAEAERNRQADDRMVRSLIDSGLLRILHAKRFGVFDCERAADHPLIADLPPRSAIPHSRWSDLSEAALAAHGYQAAVGGVVCCRRDRSLRAR